MPMPQRWHWPLRDQTQPPRDLTGGLTAYARKVFVYISGVFAAGALTMSIQEISGAVFPLVLGNVIDAFVAGGAGGKFLSAMGTLLALLAVYTLAIGVNEIFDSNSGDRAAQESVRAAGSVLALRGRSVRRKLAAGDMVTSLGDDVLQVGALAAWSPSFLASIVSAVVVTVLMFRISHPLGLLVLFGVPAALSLSLFITPRLERLQSSLREAEGRLSTITTDTVAGLRILRGVGGEERFLQHYRERNLDVRDRAIRLAAASSALTAISESAPLMLTGGVIIYGAHLAAAGQISAGSLVAFYGFTNFLASPMRVILRSMETFIKARVAARKIVTVLDAGNEGSSAANEALTREAAELDWGRAALRDEPSGLRVSAERLTGVHAPTTDIARVLAARFGAVDHARGAYIGHIPLADIEPRVAREHVLFVDSVQHVFEGTLRQAVLGARAEVPHARDHVTAITAEALDPGGATAVLPDTDTSADEDVWQALRFADAMDVCDSLPGALDGVLTEKGRNLSGGQRQRVALARARGAA